MFNQLLISIRVTLFFGLLLGVIFPFVVAGVGQMLFPEQASGSLIKSADGTVLGSKLIAQSFISPRYFQPRPSAAGAGYDASLSAGTNLGPTAKKLLVGQADDPTTKNTDESFAGVKQLVESYRKRNALTDDRPVPVDAVTRSGSGLDPDISPENAFLQAPRIAKSRNLPLASILKLISLHKEERQFAVLGEPRINVLMLNLALDRAKQ